MDLRSLASRALPPIRGAGCASFTVAMVAGAELHMRAVPSRRPVVYDRWLRNWARGVLRIFGVQLTLEGPAPPLPRGARLVVSNHRSPLDILTLISLFGGRILSRADLARWPIVGAAARQAGTIFVDRESDASGARAIRTIRRHLAAGSTITVFPEGTTYPGDEVRPFRPGAFLPLRGLDVELFPVGLAYPAGIEFWQESFVEHVGRVATRPVTRVVACCGVGRKAEGSAGQLAEEARAEVQALTTRARRRFEAL